MIQPKEVLDKVFRSEPIDRTARDVTGGGEHYDSPKRICQRHSDTPIQTIPISPTDNDLTGISFGRFTVTGKYASQPARWVVRCSCGNYETRKAKAIHNPNNAWDCCDGCRHLLYLKRTTHFRAYGVDLPREDA